MGSPRAKPPKALPGTLAWVVQTVRVSRGWTQIDLSRESGIGQSQLSVIESDQSNKVFATTLFGVCKALRIDPHEALNGKVVHRRRIDDQLSTDAHRLEVGLTNGNHAKWVAYGHGLLASQPTGEDNHPNRRHEEKK